MARKRWKSDARPCELNLTAMIDVAFQLLNFFIITVQPKDVLTHLEAFRPSPDARATDKNNSAMLRIMLLPNIYVINERRVTLSELDHKLATLAASDPSQTVLIMAARLSKHAQLIEVLDRCAKHKLTSVSVVSSAGI